VKLEDLSGTPRFILHPERYQYARVTGDFDTDNWLFIAGEVLSNGDEWSFNEPGLMVYEAVLVAEWLERVAEQQQPPVDVGADDGRFPPLDFTAPYLGFTEPYLGFSVRSYGDNSAVIRVHLDREVLPDHLLSWDTDDRRSWDADDLFWIEIEMTLAGIANAAATWRADISAFPER
jgi:hypothetical protein